MRLPGISVAEAAANASAAFGPCTHTRRVDVDLRVTGEVVAQLCTDCWVQLPVGWVSAYDPPTVLELDLSVLDMRRPDTAP